jgi:hypothetical protein
MWEQNLVGDYTYMSRLFESDQHVKVLQTHLQANLEQFLGWAEEELNDIFENDVPNSNGMRLPLDFLVAFCLLCGNQDG